MATVAIAALLRPADEVASVDVLTGAFILAHTFGRVRKLLEG